MHALLFGETGDDAHHGLVAVLAEVAALAEGFAGSGFALVYVFVVDGLGEELVVFGVPNVEVDTLGGEGVSIGVKETIKLIIILF